ncbi:MAG: CopG family ribbon-helix-helix protein [Desulfuromonadales bacterium]
MQAQAQLKPIGVKLTPELKDRLHRISEAKHRSTHWIMKEAIQQYVEREESAEQFKRETIESWEEYQRDGLHITHKEMIGWLSSWGTPNETECPPCHK